MKVELIEFGGYKDLESVFLNNKYKEVAAFCIESRNGYQHVNPLDIENRESLNWSKLNQNALCRKGDDLFMFYGWFGKKLPFDGIELFRIGRIVSE